MALPLDLGDASTFGAFAERVRETLAALGAERCDYLVNNAGISHHNSIEMTTEEEMDLLYRVNFKGVFFLTQKLLPLISDGGRSGNGQRSGRSSASGQFVRGLERPPWGRSGSYADAAAQPRRPT